MTKFLVSILYGFMGICFVQGAFAQIDPRQKVLQDMYKPTFEDARGLNHAQLLENEQEKGEIELEFEQIEALMDSADFRNAISKLNYILHTIPDLEIGHYLRGMCYKSIGKYDSAKYDLKRSLNGFEIELHGHARLQLGEIEAHQQAYKKALEQYELAQNLMPESPLPWYGKGHVELTQGKGSKARKSLDMAIAKDSSFVEAYVLKAVQYLFSAKMNLAIQEIGKIISLDSTNYQAYVMRGLLCEYRDKNNNCNDDFERAIEIEPESPLAYVLSSFSLLEDGIYSLGLHRYAQAISFEKTEYIIGENTYANKKLLKNQAIQFLDSTQSSYPIEIIKHLGIGLYKQETQEYDIAERQYNLVLKSDPENIAANWLLATLKKGTYESLDALHFYKKVYEMHQNPSLELDFRLGELYSKHNQLEISIEHFKNIVSRSGVNQHAYKALAVAYAKLNKFAQASGVYSLFLHHNRLDASILFERANTYYQLNRLDLAVADLQEGMKIDSTYYHAYALLADCYASSEMYEEAIMTLDNYMNITDDTRWLPDIYSYLGGYYSALMKYDSAVTNYSKSLDRWDRLEVRIYRAYAYYELERYDEAYTDFDIILKWDVNEPNALYYRGRILLMRGRKKEGIRDIRKAAKLEYKRAIDFLEAEFK